ncbi:MAG: adenylate/guanylate cyclase domain-containing protein [Thermomicrobiales bacterium]|nr:adenylate/guanylate cyclase domain-containing protein [Thermomicrobiales bacterium]
MGSRLPSGTVAFLFTDIEGSTARWERERDAMAVAVERHLALLKQAVAAEGGVPFKVVGDALQAAFATAPAAVAAALAAQRALLAEEWEAVGPLRVRMALHAGEAEPDAHGDYLAPALNRLSRLLATGHGGQVLLSQAVQQLARDALPDGASLRDLGAHRLRDLLEPEEVFQLCHPDLPADFPPLKSLDARPNNLPRQPTPFLGREREVREVVALLERDDVRLLTLTGTGGSGKTRLALQAAAEALDAFPDGAAFVALAPLTDPALVPSAVAQALDAPEQGGRPVIDLLRDRLAEKRFLLILDNCEHLLDAAADLVAELLAACPRLVVLATSRAPLRLRAEREWEVLPMELPPRPPPLPTAEQVSPFAAVRLFVERARAIRPSFVVDNAIAPAIAEICWRLDGLPLAIELAAARIRLFSPTALLARLEKRLPLLTGGARDAPDRQRTLRDTIAWSHDLLDQEERIAFRRLSAFAGGFSLGAAEAVANAGGDLDIIGLMERLCQHSLLRQEEDAGSEPRFAMLETVREFATERLAESGEEAATRDAHAAFFSALAEQARVAMLGPDEASWHARLTVEHGNVRAALGWLLERQQADAALALAVGVRRFWEFRYHYAEGIAWLERALAAAGPEPTRTRAWGLRSLGNLVFVSGDARRAAELYEEALAIFRAEGDDEGASLALASLAIVRTALGALAAARAAAEEGLVVSRRIGDLRGEAYALRGIGFAASVAGDLQAAAVAYDAAVAAFRTLGELWAGLSTLTELGWIALQQGDLPRARALGEEAKERAHAEADLPLELHADMLLGRVALEEGDVDAADALLTGAITGFTELSEASWAATAKLTLAAVAARREDASRARTLATDALATQRAAGTPIVLVVALMEAAGVLADLDDAPAAAGLIAEALELARSGEFQIVETEAVEGVVWALAATGDALGAARMLGAAATMREATERDMPPTRRRRLEAAERAAQMSLDKNDFDAAFAAGAALAWEAVTTEALAIATTLAKTPTANSQ